jgi:hypothetical protein
MLGWSNYGLEDTLMQQLEPLKTYACHRLLDHYSDFD